MTASEGLAEEKAALRARFRAFRAQLDPAEHAARSAALVAQAKSLPELRHARAVHTYWPLVARREVDLRPLIAWLREAGKQIVLPIVDTIDGRPAHPPRLRHARFDTAAALHPNRWGVYEPAPGKSVPIEDLDAVIVPALGAGRNGHRLGYGKGYYDAFLRAVRVPTICLVYGACFVARIPAEAHDVPLSILITEDEIFRLPTRVTSLERPS